MPDIFAHFSSIPSTHLFVSSIVANVSLSFIVPSVCTNDAKLKQPCPFSHDELICLEEWNLFASDWFDEHIKIAAADKSLYEFIFLKWNVRIFAFAKRE